MDIRKIKQLDADKKPTQLQILEADGWRIAQKSKDDMELARAILRLNTALNALEPLAKRATGPGGAISSGFEEEDQVDAKVLAEFECDIERSPRTNLMQKVRIRKTA